MWWTGLIAYKTYRDFVVEGLKLEVTLNELCGVNKSTTSQIKQNTFA
jgi:hypothetical protein